VIAFSIEMTRSPGKIILYVVTIAILLFIIAGSFYLIMGAKTWAFQQTGLK